MLLSRYLIGQTHVVLERYLYLRVCQHFGQVQGMPLGVSHYARQRQDVLKLGPCVSYETACIDYYALTPGLWDYVLYITNDGMTEDYSEFFHTHPFPRFTHLEEPIPLVDGEGGDEKGDVEGGCRGDDGGAEVGYKGDDGGESDGGAVGGGWWGE